MKKIITVSKWDCEHCKTSLRIGNEKIWCVRAVDGERMYYIRCDSCFYGTIRYYDFYKVKFAKLK